MENRANREALLASVILLSPALSLHSPCHLSSHTSASAPALLGAPAVGGRKTYHFPCREGPRSLVLEYFLTTPPLVPAPLSPPTQPTSPWLSCGGAIVSDQELPVSRKGWH